MSHKAVVVYAVDVGTFSKLIEGEIKPLDVLLSMSTSCLRQRPTGRTYTAQEFSGFTFTFIECMGVK